MMMRPLLLAQKLLLWLNNFEFYGKKMNQNLLSYVRSKSKDGKGYVAAGNMLADESAYFSLHFTDLEGKAKNSIKYDLGDLYDFDMTVMGITLWEP